MVGKAQNINLDHEKCGAQVMKTQGLCFKYKLNYKPVKPVSQFQKIVLNT